MSLGRPIESNVARPSLAARIATITRRMKPVLVGQMGRESRTFRLIPWGASVDGPRTVRFGRGVRLLRDVTIDGSGGSILLEDGVVVCRFAVLEAAGGSIRIGRNSVIGDYSSLYGQGGLNIGENVLLASGVRLVPSSHIFDRVDIPIRTQGIRGIGIKIGDGAWIGTNVVVLDGVEIGRNVIVGAGSVVTHDLSEGAIAAGVPARVLRYRYEA